MYTIQSIHFSGQLVGIIWPHRWKGSMPQFSGLIDTHSPVDCFCCWPSTAFIILPWPTLECGEEGALQFRQLSPADSPAPILWNTRSKVSGLCLLHRWLRLLHAHGRLQRRRVLEVSRACKLKRTTDTTVTEKQIHRISILSQGQCCSYSGHRRHQIGQEVKNTK